MEGALMKTFLISAIIVLSIQVSEAQLNNNRALIVPEFNNGLVKVYTPASYPNAKAGYTLNLSAIIPACASINPNGVTMNNKDLYVAIDGSCQRIYKFPGYADDPAGSIAGVSQVTNYGNDYVGLIFDNNSNLYTTEGSFDNNNLVRYNSPGYTTPPDVIGNAGVVSYLANLAFDDNGNLWVSDYLNNRIIVWDASTLATIHTYHEFDINPAISLPVANTDASLSGNANYIFESPEGVAFDGSGNLWVANNNDNGTNVQTTLVKITPGLQSMILANPAIVASAVGANGANAPNGYYIYNIPHASTDPATNAQPGGMQIDKAIGRIYVNEEINGDGLYFDIATLAAITDNYNNYRLSIVSTNPGNGGIFLAAPGLFNPAGINDKKNYNTLNVYPDPVIDILNIKSDKPVSGIFKVTDISGRTFMHEMVENKNECSLDVSVLKPGLYLFEITPLTGTSVHGRFLKQ